MMASNPRTGPNPQNRLSVWLFLVLLAFPGAAAAVEIQVVGPSGEAVTDYRWLVEEDRTFHPEPGQLPIEQLGLNFHVSHVPVVDSGDSSDLTPLLNLPPDRHYFLSVLPAAGNGMGGAPIGIDQASVLVRLAAQPTPTARMSIFVFEDNFPLNNSPDLPQELGLAGFTVILEDAGGRYGQVGGQLMMDAYGNPLGTRYNPDMSIAEMGLGFGLTDADGLALIENLVPGKYGVQVIPPEGGDWHQTTTIEGSQVIDAWLKAGEPRVMVEFGMVFPHVFTGFVQPTADAGALTGRTRVRGQVVNWHLSRPPDIVQTAPGHPILNAWVGLNDTSGRCIYAQPANPDDGTFEIANVAPGTYQLVIWDEYLDLIIDFRTINVPAAGGAGPSPGPPPVLNLGQLSVLEWFGHSWNHVFNDTNENGFPDPGEIPLTEQNINLRFRDGTVYQSMPTDGAGWSPLDRVFPFFDWLVAEVDYTRLKATGATVVVDAGGPVLPDQGWAWPSLDRLTPQLQPDNANQPYRTELGPVLLEGFQVFAGQTNVIMWGKSAYQPGENGGIAGIIFYATTRAEDDPRFAAGEPWEPGIPRVQVALYQDADDDDAIDDLDGDGGPTLADVDGFPFGFREGASGPGPEDTDRDGDGEFDPGDALQIVTSDSWDDAQPTGCAGPVDDPFYLGGRCYDGWRNFNQVRPALFDGGYAFMSHFPGGMAAGGAEVEGVPTGIYIVETAVPKGYELAKEEDRNVDFGEEYAPPRLVPVRCVGDPHVVPAEMSLFPGVPTPLAGQTRSLCDRKQIRLSDGMNAAADFFLFTEVPLAAHFTGLATNDLANEFNPLGINFVEKWSAPYMPISFRDWQGVEVNRVLTDQFGHYNGLVPGNYTVNVGSPSGLGPAMYSVCINDPGPIPDPANPGFLILDPNYRREFTHTCYTLQFLSGTTSYLDTPILPISAWASKLTYPLDCDPIDRTPVIAQVDGDQGGPYVPGGTLDGLSILSAGPTTIPNPGYDGTNAKTIVRDFGFGTETGRVLVGDVELLVESWTPELIAARLPPDTPSGQLEVVRGDNGKASAIGTWVTVGDFGGTILRVPQDFATIQQAVDAAQDGDMVMVGPGVYEELVILWKNVRVQGSGAPSTIMRSFASLPEKLQAWRDRVEAMVADGSIGLLPGQAPQFDLVSVTGLLPNGQGPTFLVTGPGPGPSLGSPAIDGFTIIGASNGGGILVNGYVTGLEVANNRIQSNHGVFGGGIRVGHPSSLFGFLEPVDAQNDDLFVHNNWIAQNGSTGGGPGGGGGIALYTGADNYRIQDNFICGNFTTGSGAGIGHLGLSRNGRIESNTIVFNQSFDQTVNDSSGGGIAVVGLLPAGGGLTAGTGSVAIVSNRILGNYAGSGDGGGVRLLRVNGQDILANRARPEAWYRIDLLNNWIVDNAAGLAGGGVSIQEAVKINILHNTIAANDSFGTAAAAFSIDTRISSQHPAGIASRAHSTALIAALLLAKDGSRFPSPRLQNNIIWRNRSFFVDLTDSTSLLNLVLQPDVGGGEPPRYWDLGVLGAGGADRMSPRNNILTSRVGYDASNLTADPRFVSLYFNGTLAGIIFGDQMTPIDIAPALDEGGNFIDVRLEPLTLARPDLPEVLLGNYHLSPRSPAVDARVSVALPGFPDLALDIDRQPRPNGRLADLGADEFYLLNAPGLAGSPRRAVLEAARGFLDRRAFGRKDESKGGL